MDTLESINKLRHYWQFESICQFFMMFYPAYGLETFETDDFEAALANQDREVITFHILKLIKFIGFGKFLNNSTWETPTLKEISQADVELPLPKKLPRSFFDLTLFQQVVCIHYLTELQFKQANEKLRAALGDEENSQDWRVVPIGFDKKGNTYYLFDDNRLYIQKPETATPKRTKSKKLKETSDDPREIENGDSLDKTWEPVCITFQDWEHFPNNFKNSRNADEKELYNTLIEDVLPQVLAELKAKERKRKKLIELATLVPKRSSRLEEKNRLQKMEEAKREKKRLLAELDKRTNSKSKSTYPVAYSREQRARRRDLKGKGDLDRLYELEKSQILNSLELKSANIDSEGEGWNFSCICGKEGRNFDDGTPQVSCEKCGVWQHIECVKYRTPDGRAIKDFDHIAYFCDECIVSPKLEVGLGDLAKSTCQSGDSKAHSSVDIRVDQFASQDEHSDHSTSKESVCSSVKDSTGNATSSNAAPASSEPVPTRNGVESVNSRHQELAPADPSASNDVSSTSDPSAPIANSKRTLCMTEPSWVESSPAKKVYRLTQ